MAERRMFAKTIIDSDLFLDMPSSTQCLYFHLSMRADDDGFIGNPRRIQKMIGSSDDDMRLLIAKQFIIPFESGIVVIKHWKIHNYIQKDRYKPTVYQEEKAMLSVKDNNEYLIPPNTLDTGCIQNVSNLDTQDRLGKVRVVEGSIGKDSQGNIPAATPTEKPKRHKYGEYQNVLLSDGDMEKLLEEFPNDWQERVERLSSYMASTGKSYKNHLATIRNWAKKDPPSKPEPSKQAPPADGLNYGVWI